MPQREDGVQASTLLCRCKMRQVFADVSLPEKATVQLGVSVRRQHLETTSLLSAVKLLCPTVVVAPLTPSGSAAS